MRNGPYDLDIDTLRAHPHGIDFGALQPRITEVLRTPSGMIEAFPPVIEMDLERLGGVLYAPPDQRLLLVGRRHLRSNNSWMHNLPVLVKGKARCTLQLHPDDAAAVGVVDGGAAQVESSAGQVVATVEVTDRIAPGTVSLPHGWGHPTSGGFGAVAAGAGGVNSNELTPTDVIDPLSGNARLNAIPVSVHPA